MGKSLYRQYRSTTFDEIIGQDHIVAVLKNSLKNGDISHAYLFSGPRGVGKTSMARILAHAVNELEYQGEDLHLDIIEIDAASNRRIDEVREIRDKVNIVPVAGKYKVYIIDEVHMLTREAFNALLKTLEEPPSHVIFILATTEINKIPDTILSRCIKLNFQTIPDLIIKQHLAKIAKNEKIKISDEALELVAKHGNGSFRDAISFLEQIKYISSSIELNDVVSTLGLASEQLVDNVLTAVENNDLKTLAELLDQAYSDGANESNLASQIAEKLRQKIIHQPNNIKNKLYINTLKDLLNVAGSHNPKIELEMSLANLAINNDYNIDTKSEPKENPNNENFTKPKKQIKQQKVDDTPVVSGNMKHEQPNDTENTSSINPVKYSDSDVWPEFLNNLKQQNNTLYGIARMATVEINDKNINLGFKFAFHHKQINDPKNLQIFRDVLKSTSEVPYELNIFLIEKDKPSNATNQDITNLSNIFGKTEMLES